MFRPWQTAVGLRYTRARRRNFISFITLVSVAGLALGVTALITVLSVMNGFEQELRARILGMTSHLTAGAADGRLVEWEAVAERLVADPAVRAAAPYVQAEAMLTHRGRVGGAIVRGVLPEREATVSDVHEHMVAGRMVELDAGEFEIVLGRELAALLGVWVGDRVTVIAPEARMTPAGVMPRLKRFRVVGVFEVGMYEYDRGMAYTHLEDAATLFRLGEGVSGVRARLDELFAAPVVSQRLDRALPERIAVTDWTQQHANFFRAIRMEKTVMFIILLLIVAVAAFNIVSTLMMVVTDKASDIAVLRTFGATPGDIMTVFVVQGTLIGLLGTAFGVAGGVALALNVETIVPFIERLFGLQFLSPEVYYISELPSELHWDDVWLIAGSAFLLTVLATLYPAWRAARVQPAEALRYE